MIGRGAFRSGALFNVFRLGLALTFGKPFDHGRLFLGRRLDLFVSAILLEQVIDGLARGCALAQPVGDAIQFIQEFLRIRLRIIVSEILEKTAISRHTAVGYHDAVAHDLFPARPG